MKCDQQDQNIASGSCARYIINFFISVLIMDSFDISLTLHHRSECRALITPGRAIPPPKKMPMPMLPRTSVLTLSEVGKCGRTSCQGQEEGMEHLVGVLQDLQ